MSTVTDERIVVVEETEKAQSCEYIHHGRLNSQEPATWAIWTRRVCCDGPPFVLFCEPCRAYLFSSMLARCACGWQGLLLDAIDRVLPL